MFLYNVFIFLYGLAIKIFSKFNDKAGLWCKGRENWEAKLRELVKPNEHYIWFHCSSLGEFEQGRPLLEKIKNNFPDKKIALTFFSPSGYEIRKNYPMADLVLYLPLDTQKNANRFIEILKPSLVVFVKYDIWLNYIFQLKRYNIPVILIAALFTQNHIYFKWYGRIFLNALQYLHIFAQDQDTYNLLKKFNCKNIAIAPDTRLDRVYENLNNFNKNQYIEKFVQNEKVFIAGSTWPIDENFICDFINNSTHKKFIIVPHQVDENHISQLKNKLLNKVILYSDIEKSDKDEIINANILIINTIGLLANIYYYADVVYIGGGFGTSIHNTLEPAVFAKPIIIGPKYKKFNEAVNLTNKQGIFVIQSPNDFSKTCNDLFENEFKAKQAGQINQQYILDNLGGTQIVFDYIANKYLKN